MKKLAIIYMLSFVLSPFVVWFLSTREKSGIHEPVYSQPVFSFAILGNIIAYISLGLVLVGIFLLYFDKERMGRILRVAVLTLTSCAIFSALYFYYFDFFILDTLPPTGAQLEF
jgi:uncharacterized Tic20 family protein